MKALLIILLAGCCGCAPDWKTPPADGSRLEYRSLGKKTDGSADYVKTADHELHAAEAPVRVPVFRTRPGPETGPYRHGELTTGFIGTEEKDAPELRRIMGMTPAAGDYVYETSLNARRAEKGKKGFANPIPRYISDRQSGKKRHSRRAENSRGDELGFREDAPAWLRDDYTGMSEEQEALLKKLKSQKRQSQRP